MTWHQRSTGCGNGTELGTGDVPFGGLAARRGDGGGGLLRELHGIPEMEKP